MYLILQFIRICIFKKNIFQAFIFLKYIHTMTMHIKLWQQHCNVYKFLKTLHPGGIRTQDLLFCRRTRWPLCHAARATSNQGLPDGLFSNQKSHCGEIVEDLRMENVEIFYGIWNILCTFEISCEHLVHFVLICYIFPFLVSCTKKNLATLLLNFCFHCLGLDAVEAWPHEWEKSSKVGN
jgi:hypothetical protein